MSNASVRSLKTGGTPNAPGVEFVRYSRFYGLGFRQTARKTPRMAVRAVFRARPALGEHDLDGCHPVGQGRIHGRIFKPVSVTAKFPAGGSSRDHVGRIVGHDGATLGRGPRDGVRGLEHLAARRSRGGPETPGQRGHSPPPASAGDPRSVATRSTLARLRNGRTARPWGPRPDPAAASLMR